MLYFCVVNQQRYKSMGKPSISELKQFEDNQFKVFSYEIQPLEGSSPEALTDSKYLDHQRFFKKDSCTRRFLVIRKLADGGLEEPNPNSHVDYYGQAPVEELVRNKKWELFCSAERKEESPDFEHLLLLEAIKCHGESFQKEKIKEECLELALALQRLSASGESCQEAAEKDVIDEIADVTIMMRYCPILFSKDKIEARIAYKLERLKKRLAAQSHE